VVIDVEQVGVDLQRGAWVAVAHEPRNLQRAQPRVSAQRGISVAQRMEAQLRRVVTGAVPALALARATTGRNTPVKRGVACHPRCAQAIVVDACGQCAHRELLEARRTKLTDHKRIKRGTKGRRHFPGNPVRRNLRVRGTHSAGSPFPAFRQSRKVCLGAYLVSPARQC